MPPPLPLRVLLTALLVTLCACAPNPSGGRLLSAPPPRTFTEGRFTIEWSGVDLKEPALRVRGPTGRVVWESVPRAAFVSAARGTETVKESRGSFTIEDSIGERCPDQRVDSLEQTSGGVLLRGELPCPGGALGYVLRLSQVSESQLQFDLSFSDPSYDRAYLTAASTPDERFFGFGEQFTYFDLKGSRVPIFVMEQGIGRGAFPITLGANLTAGAGGDWHTSYAGVPQYVTSRLRSVFLESTEFSAFDLRDPERVTIEVYAPRMTGRIVSGETPLELVESFTEYSGRMRRLPDWILSGAVIGMQGGTDKVREVRGKLQAHGVPVAAFWLQDWVGQRITTFGKQLWWNWELDPDRYPGWDALVAELRGSGVRMMTYVNPFFADVEGVKPNARRNLFQEAKARGHLVRHQNGEPYLIQNTSFSAGLLDLSSPEARAWMKDLLVTNVLGAGASGWMADFGEALPYDALLAQGTAPAFHNRYPEEWARLNREAIEEAGLEDEAVFFSRSGYTRSPGQTSLFWLGDQLVSWDEHDGLKSAVTGLLSSGLSGYAFNHSDIGGYTTIDNALQNYHRSAELLERWTELSAFNVVFRTHEGNRPERNVQVYSDDESLAHFGRMARVYAAWGFYRKQLVDEAARTGHPVARHLFLHYPEDTEVYRLRHEEFLVGSELLVAPVTDPGRTSVRVYLPAGEWVHLWTGASHGRTDAGTWVTVEAPIGSPAVFHPRGSAVGEQLRRNLADAGLL